MALDLQRAAAIGMTLVVAMSPIGLDNLKQHEGMSLRAYPDPYYGWHVATICWGHTGEHVKQGMQVSQQQCDAWLASDVARHCKLVYEAVKPHNVWLTQGEQDAYCDFAYNLGRFKGTESVYGRLIRGDDWGACEGLMKYTYSNGKPSKGLYNRRYKEYLHCVSQLEPRESK